MTSPDDLDPSTVDGELEQEASSGRVELLSGYIDYSSNTRTTPTVGGPCPPGTVRDGDAVVYKENDDMGGWCEFRGWVNPGVPTDCSFKLHIGADVWHGGGRVIWKVNGYRLDAATPPVR